MDPKAFFDSTTIRSQSGKCFVLMPFDEGLTEIYDTIREAVKDPKLRFDCQRADDILGGGHIMDGVLKGIAESEIVIADLTGANANVFYELGIVHMVKKPNKVILLIQDMNLMPFDLSAFRCIEYKHSIAGAAKLKSDLVNAITEVADLIKLPGEGSEPIYQFRVQERETYKFPVQLFGDSNCLYDFEMFPDYVGADGAKITLRVTQYIAGQLPRMLDPEGSGVAEGMTQKVPKIPWELELDSLSGKTARFRLKHQKG